MIIKKPMSELEKRVAKMEAGKVERERERDIEYFILEYA
jgi:hypothetical protein